MTNVVCFIITDSFLRVLFIGILLNEKTILIISSDPVYKHNRSVIEMY